MSKLLLDVPLEGLERYLVQYGHEIHTDTKERVIPNDALLKYASDNGCVLVIEDKKASKIALGMGIRVINVDMKLIAKEVHNELTSKYPGVIEPYAEELFRKNNGRALGCLEIK